MNEKFPLVSVCIVTYNSAKFLVDTLDSIKNQTYDNIELIIGDDASKDNTVVICKKWITENKDRFISTTIVTQPTNKGVCNNLNACYSVAKGDWIKIIAGDDILLPNCISDYVSYIVEKPQADILFSKMIHFSGDVYNKKNSFYEDDSYTQGFFLENDEKKLYSVARKNALAAPTLFHRNGIIQNLGGYDTDYCFEDWPMWLKLLENHYKFDYIDKYTVAYRHHSASVSSFTNKFFNFKLESDIYKFRQKYCFKYYSSKEIKFVELDYKLKKLQHKFKMDYCTLGNRIVNSIKNRSLLFIKTICVIDKNLY